ncbi:MAG: methylmalonyl-CoA mutase family protein [Thermodesulfobacteriota bacterium]|nr:methylmalonyl-CoA mutase family protein [Thermodesulfobacteriota bacterium]
MEEELEIGYFEKVRRPFTWSGLPVKEVYGPEDTKDINYEKDIGKPGEFPYKRGIHQNMYRGRLWTRREVAGFGGGAETNERLRFQIDHGFTGLSVIFDNPGKFGIDADHPFAEHETGKCGVSLSSIEEMRAMVAGLPLDKISMAFDEGIHNGLPAIAQYFVVAEEQGIKESKLRGTIQADSLHAHVIGCQKAIDPDLTLKFWVDLAEYCTRNVPSWYTLNCNGYDLRDNGELTAAQEIAFAFSLAISYFDAAIRRGLDVDEFAPRTGFYFCSHIDFFEEIAKFRAARKLWAVIMKERYGAKNPRSQMLRFGVHTSGSSLTPQQIINNVSRTTVEGMAAILGGVQTLNICAYDEPVAIPTEMSHRTSVRIQQILGYEAGLGNTVDPLAGSYFVESLTKSLEDEIMDILGQVEDIGGALQAVKTGWFLRQVEESFIKHEGEIGRRERVKVGLNAFTVDEESPVPGGFTRISSEMSGKIIETLKRFKEKRDQNKVKKAISELRADAEKGENFNLIPSIKKSVKANATTAEILGTIREAYGFSYDPFEMIESPF